MSRNLASGSVRILAFGIIVVSVLLAAAAAEARNPYRRALFDRYGTTLTDSQLDDLHRRGVRGVRINTSPIAPFDAGRADELIPRVEKLGQRLAGAGWCLEFLGPAWLTPER